MKTYEIGMPGQSDPIWIKADCKVILLDSSEQVEYVKEIDVDNRMPGVDIVMQSNTLELLELLTDAANYIENVQLDFNLIDNGALEEIRKAIKKAENLY